jgi:hypothetical protein
VNRVAALAMKRGKRTQRFGLRFLIPKFDQEIIANSFDLLAQAIEAPCDEGCDAEKSPSNRARSSLRR